MIGRAFGNFRITRQLGAGGMGEVFLAEQVAVKTQVAIKVLHANISRDQDQVQRFFNEAIAASKVRHPGIVQIFDVGFSEDRAYLVMEYLDGESLAHRLARGALPVDELCRLGGQITNLLQAIHAVGITHRDLKPDNIFLVRDPEIGMRVKILDFGIAKLGGSLGGMTSTSVGAMGTPHYMAPEQWMNAKLVDWRSDAYSLGCVLFEMATGKTPFEAETIGEACAKHLSVPPPVVTELAPSLPRSFAALVAQLLEKRPEQRPASMTEIAQRLDALRGAGSAPVTAPAIPRTTPPAVALATTIGTANGAVAHSIARPPKSDRGVIIALAGAVGAVAIAGIVTVLLLGRGGSSPASPSVQAAAPRADAGPELAVAASVQPAPSAAPAPLQPAPAAPAAVAETVERTPPPPPPHHIAALPKEQVAAAKAALKQAAQAATPNPPSDGAGGCDEVSCVLNNYDGACCRRFRKKPAVADKAPSEIPDALDRSMISEGVGAVKARIVVCGARSSVSGKVKVGVKVGADGTVQSVDVRETPDAALGSCVAAAMQRATFPRTKTGGSFAYPFVFGDGGGN